MNKSKTLNFVIIVALLGGTLALTGMISRRVPQPLAVPLSGIDREIAGWTAAGQDLALDERSLKALDATSYLVRSYRKENRNIDLFVAFYARQRAGESMHSPKHCLPGGGWEIWRHDSATIPVGGSKIRVNKFSIQNAGRRMLMLYWYQSDSRIIASEYLGKVLLARDTLLTGRTSASIVRIMLPDVPGAPDDAVAFASNLVPEVQRCFTGRAASHP